MRISLNKIMSPNGDKMYHMKREQISKDKPNLCFFCDNTSSFEEIDIMQTFEINKEKITISCPVWLCLKCKKHTTDSSQMDFILKKYKEIVKNNNIIDFKTIKKEEELKKLIQKSYEKIDW